MSDPPIMFGSLLGDGFECSESGSFQFFTRLELTTKEANLPNVLLST